MTRGILAGVASALCTALFALLQRGVIRGGIGGAASAAIAFHVGFLLFLAYFTASGRVNELRAAWKLDGRILLLVGMISTVGNVAPAIGLQFASAGTWGVLSRLDVGFSLAIGWVLLGERVGRWSSLGMALMLGGTLAMAQAGRGGGQPREWIGMLLFVVSALAVAVNGYVAKGVLHRQREDVLSVNNLACICIAIPLLAVGLGQAGDWLRLLQWPRGLAAALLSGVVLFPSFLLYYVSLRWLPLWAVRLVAITFPVAVLVGGWALYGEQMAPRQLWGIGAVLLGFLCMVRGIAREKTPVAQAVAVDAPRG